MSSISSISTTSTSSSVDVVVVGSANVDFVVYGGRFPHPGETMRGDDFQMFPGGKGGNQAIQSALLFSPSVAVLSSPVAANVSSNAVYSPSSLPPSSFSAALSSSSSHSPFPPLSSSFSLRREDRVALICKTGDDANGNFLRTFFSSVVGLRSSTLLVYNEGEDEEMNEYVENVEKIQRQEDGRMLNGRKRDEKGEGKICTGVASIFVSTTDGNNSIIVVGGANDKMKASDLHKTNLTKILKECKCIIGQNEIPLETTMEAFRIGKKKNGKKLDYGEFSSSSSSSFVSCSPSCVDSSCSLSSSSASSSLSLSSPSSSVFPLTLFNPSPMPSFLPSDFFEIVDVVCLNVGEAEEFFGAAAPRELIAEIAKQRNEMEERERRKRKEEETEEEESEKKWKGEVENLTSLLISWCVEGLKRRYVAEKGKKKEERNEKMEKEKVETKEEIRFVITLGALGCFVSPLIQFCRREKKEEKEVVVVVVVEEEKEKIKEMNEKNGFIFFAPSLPKNETVVDTTGAGDSFLGALAYFISVGGNVEDSARKSCAVASRSVSRRGGSMSYRSREELMIEMEIEEEEEKKKEKIKI